MTGLKQEHRKNLEKIQERLKTHMRNNIDKQIMILSKKGTKKNITTKKNIMILKTKNAIGQTVKHIYNKGNKGLYVNVVKKYQRRVW